jgi:hypothetical protein
VMKINPKIEQETFSTENFFPKQSCCNTPSVPL